MEPVTAAPRDGAPISILIIEDDSMVAGCIRAVLEELGFTVAGMAASGTVALSLAGQHRPTLALVDIRLSGPMDGVEVACLLRDQYGVPTIFLSASRDPATAERARDVRPAGFVSKPFRPSQVFNAIESACAAIESARHDALTVPA